MVATGSEIVIEFVVGGGLSMVEMVVSMLVKQVGCIVECLL
jgi:hypothetical protein